jgi:predicted nucleic acid-binding protein
VQRCVIDASVVALWYFPEPLSAQADALLAGDCELLAPDTLLVEIATLVRRRVHLGEIDAEAARAVLGELRRVPFEKTPAASLVPAALDLALGTADLTVADGLYLALARRIPCPLVTADPHLHAAAHAAGHTRTVLWLGDLPLP